VRDRHGLEPLDEAGLRRLLAQLMGADEGPPAFSRWLHRSSAGNVMFALETLRSLFESGVLRLEGGAWSTELDAITRDYGELETPRAIAEVVQRRAARLSGAAHRVLQAAAVLGSGLAPATLARVTGLSEWAALDALEELERSGMLAGDAFRHDLLRQSVYRGLPAARRRLLHGRVAHALDAEAQPIVVAEHLLAAGELEDAAPPLLRAVERLERQGLADQAIALLERSVAAAERERPGHAVAWRLKAALARVCRTAARPERAMALAEEVLASAPNAAVAAAALETKAGLLLSLGRLEEAERTAREVQAAAEREGLTRLYVQASVLVASVAFHQGRLQEALAITQRNVAELRAAGDEGDLASQLTSLGAVHDQLGEHEAALPAHLEALAIARRLRSRYQQVNVAMNLLECYVGLGRADEGLAVAREALALGTFEGTATLRHNLAATLMDLGRHDEAAEWFEVQVREVSDPTLTALAWGRLARLHHHAGRGAEAQAAARRAVEQAHATDYPVARVSVARSLLELGDASLLDALPGLLAGLDPAALPPELRAAGADQPA